jgi:hypothetical protein
MFLARHATYALDMLSAVSPTATTAGTPAVTPRDDGRMSALDMEEALRALHACCAKNPGGFPRAQVLIQGQKTDKASPI